MPSAAEDVGAVWRLGVSAEKLRYDRNASKTGGKADTMASKATRVP
jgi:hypothetical protein